MLASFLVTFRETLEAAFVISIVLTFLSRTGQLYYRKYIFTGVFIGIVLSIFLSLIISVFFSSFSGRTEQIFEGIMMFLTAGFLALMILWVHRQGNIVSKIESRVSENIKTKYLVGLIFFSMFSVLREGVETVFYLRAVSFLASENQLTGIVLGFAVALVISIGVYKFSINVPLYKLLRITGAFLLLFGAGIVAHGVHEFQEVGLLPIFSFDPLVNLQHILDHQSIFGSILRTLFGYTSVPTLLELVSYTFFILLIFIFEVFSNYTLSTRRIARIEKR